jgi:hypothetical protein
MDTNRCIDGKGADSTAERAPNDPIHPVDPTVPTPAIVCLSGVGLAPLSAAVYLPGIELMPAKSEEHPVAHPVAHPEALGVAP